MKSILIATTFVLIVAATVSAEAADLSLDAKRALSYGTTAVQVKVCNLSITPAENTQMMNALAKYAEAQKDLSQDDFTETMKTVGSKIAENKDAICAQLATQPIAQMLAEDEAGQ